MSPCPSAAPLPKNSCPWDGGGYLILELLFPALGLPEGREGGGAEGGTLGGDTATPQVAPRGLGVPLLGRRWQMEHPSARSAWHGAPGLWGRARCLQPVPGCWLCPAGICSCQRPLAALAPVPWGQQCPLSPWVVPGSIPASFPAEEWHHWEKNRHRAVLRWLLGTLLFLWGCSGHPGPP